MTTVTISEDTHRKLKVLKNNSDASSFDELLDELADEKIGTPESMFGALKGIKEGEIRDRSDRIDRYE